MPIKIQSHIKEKAMNKKNIMKAKYHAIKQKTMKNNTIIYTAISLDNYIYIFQN